MNFNFDAVREFVQDFEEWWCHHRPIGVPPRTWRPGPNYHHGAPEQAPFLPSFARANPWLPRVDVPVDMLSHIAHDFAFRGCPIDTKGLR